MTRKTAREIAVELCFAASANESGADELVEAFFSEDHFETLSSEDELFAVRPDEKQLSYIRTLIGLSREKREEIDSLIERYARGWKVERISRTALAVLRIALCEILYLEDIPAAVAINEAVELDKGYDDPDTVAFVNGVLGGFMRGEMPGEAAAETTDGAE